MSTVATVGLLALILIAPFEALRPALHIAGHSVSGLEAALLTVFAVWAVSLVWFRTRPMAWTSVTGPWLVFLFAMTVAALSAPVHRGNALNMAGRLGLAFAVYLLAVNAAMWRRCVSATVWAAAISGTVVSGLVFLEYADIGPTRQVLTAFRPSVAYVGDQVRAGGPFQYPTIASMYLEVIFALVLGLLVLSLDRARIALAWMTAFLLLGIAQSIALTFTRTGLITMGGSLLFIGLRRYRASGADRVVTALASVALAVGLLVLGTHTPESMQLRLTSEGQEAWYRASIEAPAMVSLSANQTIDVPLQVTNTGRRTWETSSAPRVRLSYHWLSAEEELVVGWEGLRSDFARPVEPGETVSLAARVQAPPHPGRYRLLWDVEQEDRLWFSTEPGAIDAVSWVDVVGQSPHAAIRVEAVQIPPQAVRPGRLVLWRAAVRMLVSHPLTGVGPDNFRLLYGQYSGLDGTDPRVHSNNMYLEVLAGGGLFGGLAFAWLLWRGTRASACALRESDRSRTPLTAALVAACMAIVLHGVVDTFLGFTATYILFAIMLGLVAGSDRSLDAHRV